MTNEIFFRLSEQKAINWIDKWKQLVKQPLRKNLSHKKTKILYLSGHIKNKTFFFAVIKHRRQILKLFKRENDVRETFCAEMRSSSVHLVKELIVSSKLSG